MTRGEITFVTAHEITNSFSCAQKRRDFLRSRRNLLNTLYALPLELKIEKSKRIIKEAVSEFGIKHVYI